MLSRLANVGLPNPLSEPLCSDVGHYCAPCAPVLIQAHTMGNLCAREAGMHRKKIAPPRSFQSKLNSCAHMLSGDLMA